MATPGFHHAVLGELYVCLGTSRSPKKANKDIKVYACHPGASATSLIKTSGNLFTRSLWYLMTLTPLVQSAGKGAYPEVMCATEEELDQKGFYGPTRVVESTWLK